MRQEYRNANGVLIGTTQQNGSKIEGRDRNGRLVALDKRSARLNSAGLGANLPYHRLTNALRKRNEFGS